MALAKFRKSRVRQEIQFALGRVYSVRINTDHDHLSKRQRELVKIAEKALVELRDSLKEEK
jgi:hypothetical protein